jgi:hypothetical protein
MLRLISIAVVCTMLLIPIAGFSSNIISNGPLLIAVSFGLAYVAAPAVLLHIWPARTGQQHKSMQDALWDGELLSQEYRVSAVAEIEEVEDEGFHFLLSTNSGETLYLSGQYLYGAVERSEFPSESVRLFSNKKTGLRYGIEPGGPKFQSWPVYSSFTSQPACTPFDLEDGTLYKEGITELMTKFGFHPVVRGA